MMKEFAAVISVRLADLVHVVTIVTKPIVSSIGHQNVSLLAAQICNPLILPLVLTFKLRRPTQFVIRD